jgi:branched-subunit amino acid transport protein
MSVLIAVVVVGFGSLLFRAVPLVGAHRLPVRLAEAAGFAGLAVIAAITVRAVLLHEDGSIPAAPLVAALAVGLGLLLASRGHGVPVAVGAGLASYLLLAAALSSFC